MFSDHTIKRRKHKKFGNDISNSILMERNKSFLPPITKTLAASLEVPETSMEKNNSLAYLQQKQSKKFDEREILEQN